jgi:hypothetical protein
VNRELEILVFQTLLRGSKKRWPQLDVDQLLENAGIECLEVCEVIGAWMDSHRPAQTHQRSFLDHEEA